MLVEAEEVATETGRTLTSFIEYSLREMLGRRWATGVSRPVKLTTVSGRGVQPGVDLDDSAV